MSLLAQTSYLWGVMLLSPLWIYIFFRKPSSRKELIILGCLFGIAAILINRFYALNDYWNPPYILGSDIPIEDFLYGFFFGGIIGEFFEFAFHLSESKRKYKRQFNLLIYFLNLTAITFLFIVDILKLNSIVAHIIPPILVAMIIFFFRKDLIIPSLYSAITITVLTFIWQTIILLIYPNAITDFWSLKNLTGILIIGVPIEELIFAFSLGLGGANFFEFTTGKRFLKPKARN